MIRLTVTSHPKIKNSYRFNYPFLDAEAQKVMDDAGFLIYTEEYEKAIPLIKPMLLKYPEAIKGWTELGTCFQELLMPTDALAYFKTAYHIAMYAIREVVDIDGTFTFPWRMETNQPFYLISKELAREYLRWDMIDEASDVLTFILRMDSSDPQHVSHLVVQCFLAMGEYRAVLDYYSMHPETNLEDTISNLMNVILAYFALSDRDVVKTLIRADWPNYKYYFEELLKPTHRRPKITLANRYELEMQLKRNAFYYALDCKKYWMEVPGAMDFVDEMVKLG